MFLDLNIKKRREESNTTHPPPQKEDGKSSTKPKGGGIMQGKAPPKKRKAGTAAAVPTLQSVFRAVGRKGSRCARALDPASALTARRTATGGSNTN